MTRWLLTGAALVLVAASVGFGFYLPPSRIKRPALAVLVLALLAVVVARG